MFSQIKLGLRATKVFFLLRFVASLALGLIYIFVAANIQYFFVKLLGENTFNYLIGGFLSLIVGVIVCSFLGAFIFLIIRGWHMSALAYAKKIVKKGYPALDAGMTVFKKHFTSFAMTWGVGFLIKKAAGTIKDNLLVLLEEVPYVELLKQFSTNPIVSKLLRDIFDTAFDAIVYYQIRYTKPGISDDAEVLIESLRKYLYSLPHVIFGSFSSLVMLYILPKIIATFIVLFIFMRNGILAGVLICTLLFPIGYMMNKTFFEPIETIILISGFAKQCQKQDDSEEANVYGDVVDEILVEMGLLEDEGDKEEESDVETASDKIDEVSHKKERSKPSTVSDESSSTVSRGVTATARQKRVNTRSRSTISAHTGEETIDVEPDFTEDSDRPKEPDLTTMPIGGVESSKVSGPSGQDIRKRQPERVASLAALFAKAHAMQSGVVKQEDDASAYSSVSPGMVDITPASSTRSFEEEEMEEFKPGASTLLEFAEQGGFGDDDDNPNGGGNIDML